MPQKCAALRHYYARYYEGGLSDGERLHVERHLRSCAECYEDYQAYVSTCDLLHGLPPVEAPFGFASRVRFALRAEPEPAKRIFLPSFQTPSLTYLLPSLGAVALVVAASAFMMTRYTPWERGAPSPPPDSPRVATARAEAPPPAAHVSLPADRAAMESDKEVEEVEALIEDINALASQIRSEPIFLGGDDAHELVFDPYAIYHRPAEPVEAAAAAYSP
ncbi:MAG: hypothetical protein JSV08_01260 [Acidobacteriota bacterium]|nr:MAG: hypothetical protein JSV08_01260 [Acidobacteriota bacterium]